MFAVISSVIIVLKFGLQNKILVLCVRLDFLRFIIKIKMEKNYLKKYREKIKMIQSNFVVYVLEVKVLLF
jgi:hypothetical protein